MRILPCGHNYHIECIDPWLTSKSSLCPLCKYDTRSVLTDLERALSGPLITADDGNVDDIFAGSSVYSDSSDPSSYLVESHARMPLSSIVAEFKRIASEKIAAPLGQITSKMAAMCRKSEPGNQNRSNEKSPSSINAGSIYYGDQERGSNSYPFENSNAIFTTSTPAFPQMDLSGANKFGLDVIHCAVGSSSAMVKVNTSDPTPSPTSKPANTWRAASEKGSASSDSGQSDSADKNKKGDGAGNSVSLGLSRISIGELLHNDQDIMDCFD
ncbi:hypothetical protein H4S06_004661 [Coemansia sp. BCRC 34490]|nr:hypothetical protein H4S06_004661 [Coemansia sp. BCRC 34490]